MKIRLTALDTLFFRDGKPFDKGEETWASGIFPPSPSSFYGALRSLYFVNNPQEISKAGENNDPTKALIIKDIQLIVDDALGFLCPADLVKVKDDDDDIVLLNLKKKNSTQITSDTIFKDFMLSSDEEVESLVGTDLIVGVSLNDYLNSESPYTTTKIANKVTLEPKVGIARDNNTHVTEDGRLYRVGMIRPEDDEANKLSFDVSFELDGLDLNIGDKGFLKLGGESKAMSYEVIADTSLTAFENNGNYFKVFLTTPAIFKNGWYPSFLNKNNDFKGIFNGINVQLIAASIGKPKYIGGFDIKNRKPKPMTKVVAEGAVYFFKVLDEGAEFTLYHPFSISDDKVEEGFGVAYCAAVTKQLEL
jgi:CRISPR-associated protein Cmr3